MRRAVVITLIVLGLTAPAGALAAGGWVPVVLGGGGVSVAGSPSKFIALPSGSSTLVEQVARDGGTVRTTNLIHGAFGVPGAANDGSTTGLSADGRTLVLAESINSYPPTRTRLVVMDARSLQVRTRIALAGFFTVDAISPTGRWLYLTHYLLGSNASRYEVRAYDLSDRQLLARPIVDPRSPSEKMQGVALTRLMGPGGRWAYTLYQGATGVPFIHALDTAARRAFCVDLPALNGADLSNVSLALSSGSALRVMQHGSPLALMNTRTFAVSRAAAAPSTPTARPAPSARHARARAGSDSWVLWPLAIVLSVALFGLAVLARRRWQSSSPAPASIRVDVVSRIDP